LAAKTANNALETLIVCLNAAVDDGLLAVNPALRVQRLPPAHIEAFYNRQRRHSTLNMLSPANYE
jgi:transposase InsO family protein